MPPPSSTQKRPLAELSANIGLPTPSRRYAPSTPHAIRALQLQQQQQKRSSAKKTSRSIRRTTTAHKISNSNDNTATIVGPDFSARAILKRLAKITAPSTRRLAQTPTVAVADKENRRPVDDADDDDDDDDDDNDDHISKKPRMTFNIDESLEDSFNEEEVPRPQYDEDDDDSGLPSPPTQTILLDDEPTNTFRLVAAAARKRQSAASDRHGHGLAAADPDADADDYTILTERGRRAISEEPTRRLSRYSFGSLHMADVWMELEQKEQEEKLKSRLSDAQSLLDRHVASDPVMQLPEDDETQDLRRLRHSPSAEPEHLESDLFVTPGIDGDTFQLEMPQEDGDAEASVLQPRLSEQEDASSDGETTRAVEDERQMTELESAALTASTTRRRKRVKMTKNGHIVPSLPVGLIKHIASEVQVRNGRRRPKLGKDQVAALEQATEWFFEQAGEDLAAYAEHSRRKKRIDQADVLMLMRRQRVLTHAGRLDELARQWLPRKALDDLDL